MLLTKKRLHTIRKTRLQSRKRYKKAKKGKGRRRRRRGRSFRRKRRALNLRKKTLKNYKGGNRKSILFLLPIPNNKRSEISQLLLVKVKKDFFTNHFNNYFVRYQPQLEKMTLAPPAMNQLEQSLGERGLIPRQYRTKKQIEEVNNGLFVLNTKLNMESDSNFISDLNSQLLRLQKNNPNSKEKTIRDAVAKAISEGGEIVIGGPDKPQPPVPAPPLQQPVQQMEGPPAADPGTSPPPIEDDTDEDTDEDTDDEQQPVVPPPGKRKIQKIKLPSPIVKPTVPSDKPDKPVVQPPDPAGSSLGPLPPIDKPEKPHKLDVIPVAVEGDHCDDKNKCADGYYCNPQNICQSDDSPPEEVEEDIQEEIEEDITVEPDPLRPSVPPSPQAPGPAKVPKPAAPAPPAPAPPASTVVFKRDVPMGSSDHPNQGWIIKYNPQKTDMTKRYQAKGPLPFYSSFSPAGKASHWIVKQTPTSPQPLLHTFPFALDMIKYLNDNKARLGEGFETNVLTNMTDNLNLIDPAQDTYILGPFKNASQRNKYIGVLRNAPQAVGPRAAAHTPIIDDPVARATDDPGAPAIIDDEPQEKDSKISVATINVYNNYYKRWPEKLSLQLQKNPVDIVCLQESPILVNELSKVEGYKLAEAADPWGGRNKSERLALLIKNDSKWKLESTQQIPSPPSCPTERFSHVYTLKNADKQVKVANVHLCGGAYDSPQLQSKTEEELKKIKEEVLEGLPPDTDIVVGDFNSDMANYTDPAREPQSKHLAYKLKQNWTKPQVIAWNVAPFDYLQKEGFQHIPITENTSMHGVRPDAIWFKKSKLASQNFGIIDMMTKSSVMADGEPTPQEPASDHDGIYARFTFTHPAAASTGPADPPVVPPAAPDTEGDDDGDSDIELPSEEDPAKSAPGQPCDPKCKADQECVRGVCEKQGPDTPGEEKAADPVPEAGPGEEKAAEPVPEAGPGEEKTAKGPDVPVVGPDAPVKKKPAVGPDVPAKKKPAAGPDVPEGGPVQSPPPPPGVPIQSPPPPSPPPLQPSQQQPSPPPPVSHQQPPPPSSDPPSPPPVVGVDDPIRYHQPWINARLQVYPGPYQPGLRVTSDSGVNFQEWLRHLGQPNPFPSGPEVINVVSAPLPSENPPPSSSKKQPPPPPSSSKKQPPPSPPDPQAKKKLDAKRQAFARKPVDREGGVARGLLGDVSDENKARRAAAAEKKKADEAAAAAKKKADEAAAAAKKKADEAAAAAKKKAEDAAAAAKAAAAKKKAEGIEAAAKKKAAEHRFHAKKKADKKAVETELQQLKGSIARQKNRIARAQKLISDTEALLAKTPSPKLTAIYNKRITIQNTKVAAAETAILPLETKVGKLTQDLATINARTFGSSNPSGGRRRRYTKRRKSRRKKTKRTRKRSK